MVCVLPDYPFEEEIDDSSEVERSSSPAESTEDEPISKFLEAVDKFEEKLKLSNFKLVVLCFCLSPAQHCSDFPVHTTSLCKCSPNTGPILSCLCA